MASAPGPYFNQIVCALRFFYRQVLKTDWAVEQIPYQRTGRRLPEILSPQEVAALFRATPNLKHRALLMTMYAGGLRVWEVTHLRVTDIDGQRMVIRIEQGKELVPPLAQLGPTVLLFGIGYWLMDVGWKAFDRGRRGRGRGLLTSGIGLVVVSGVGTLLGWPVLLCSAYWAIRW